MSTILPPLEDDIGSIPELLDAVQRRFQQARSLDPWCGLPRPFLALETRVEILSFFSLFALVPAALVLGLFWRGPLFLLVLFFGTIVFALVIYSSRRRSARIRRWRSQADVVPAFWVMANEKLHEPGSSDLPGVVVYTFDPDLQRDPVRLWELASALFDLKSAERALMPEDARDIARHLAREACDYQPRRVPHSMCGNHETWISDVFVERSRMPNGFIDRPLVFCLAHRSGAPSTIELMPADIWWSRATDALTLGDSESELRSPTEAPALERLDESSTGAGDLDVIIDRHGVHAPGFVAVDTAATDDRVEDTDVDTDVDSDRAARTERETSTRASAEEADEVLVALRYGKSDVRTTIAALIGMLIVGGLVLRFAPAIWLRLAGGGLIFYTLFQLLTLAGQRRSHLRADADGIADHRMFETRRVAWAGIERVRMGEINKTLTGRDGSKTVRIEIDDSNEAWDAVVDRILMRTESLRWIAWGTGVGSADDAPRDRSTLPTRIEVTNREIFVHGPFDNRIRFPRRRPDFALIEESLRCRLVPVLLDDAAAGFQPLA